MNYDEKADSMLRDIERDISTIEQELEQDDLPSCVRPPTGWVCTRGLGHDGPCATVPTSHERLVDRLAAVAQDIVEAGFSERIQWTITGGLLGVFDRGGYRFTSVVQQYGLEGWHALGLVSPLSDTYSLDTILATHSHLNLGQYPDLGLAQDAAREFLLTAPVPATPCSCEDLSEADTLPPPADSPP